MRKQSRLSLGGFGALMAALALAGPAAGIAPKDPARRAYAEALKGKPKKPKPKEPDAGRRVRARVNPRRAERRAWGKDFALLMGRPMSARTWNRLRKGFSRGALKHPHSLAALFVVRAITLSRVVEEGS